MQKQNMLRSIVNFQCLLLRLSKKRIKVLFFLVIRYFSFIPKILLKKMTYPDEKKLQKTKYTVEILNHDASSKTQKLYSTQQIKCIFFSVSF